MSQGYKGISFPFRVGINGGIALSSTSSPLNVSHLSDSIKQIIGTRRGERAMEYHVFSDIDAQIFEPNDESSHTMLEYQIKDALSRLEPRVQVLDISISSSDRTVYTTIHYKDLLYNTGHRLKVKVGDMSENSN